MKKIFILTGPMGSGNHMFTKIFSLHPEVNGWDELNDGKYRAFASEPHNEIWNNAEAVDNFDWGGDYHLLSISSPYIRNGESVMPDFKSLVEKFRSKGFDVHIILIGRDKNIAELQQKRLRGECTTPELLSELPYLTTLPHTFVSFELSSLYQFDYIMSIGKVIGIPVTEESEHYESIFNLNANKPYVDQIKEGVYDSIIRERQRKGRERRGYDTDVDIALRKYQESLKKDE